MIATVLAFCLATLLQTGATRAAAAETPPAATTARVRALDLKAAALLSEGPLRSATFENLVNVLEQSDVIVLVETGLVGGFPAQTTFMTATPDARFLHVMLSVPETDDRLLAWLAHELQHAVEIASAPEVTSVAALHDFYRRYGQVLSDRSVCTADAQRVTTQVGGELAMSPRPRS